MKRGKLFDATNDIIRRITRYAAQLSEKNALGANRKEEYRKVAELFLKCQDMEEAHKMSAMVFGMECPQHIAGDLVRETDSMNIGVYEEQPMEISLKPRIRTYREKSRRSAIRESAEQKQETRRKMLEKQREEMEKLQALEVNGKDSFWRITGAGTKNQRDPFEMAVGCHGIYGFFLQERMMEEDTY